MELEKRMIPNYSNYEISNFGEIVNVVTGNVIVPTRNNTGVLIAKLKSDTWKWVSPTIARLILSTFKPLNEDWKYSYAYVKYLDENRNNLRLDNLEWCFNSCIPMFVPGINISYNDFVTIMSFPKYEINANGVIRNKRKGMICQGYESESGYIRYNLTNIPNKYVGVSLHRILALTFLEHPVETDHLIINHKDGNPKNNQVSNLEWTTYSGNISHAYQTGLRSDNTALLVMNEKTNDVKYFHSFGSCARFLGVTPQALHYWCQREEWKPYKGYWIKKADSAEPWPTEHREFKKRINEAKPVSVENTKNGEILVFESSLSADKYFDFRPGTSKYRAFTSSNNQYQEYLITPFISNVGLNGLAS